MRNFILINSLISQMKKKKAKALVVAIIIVLLTIVLIHLVGGLNVHQVDMPRTLF